MNHQQRFSASFGTWAALVVVLVSISDRVFAQASADPRYQTRQSDCRHEPPPGAALSVRRTDSGITKRGYLAEQVLTQSADASRTKGGELLVCTEYGGVEIADSDDNQVRLQIRIEGSGEGSTRPADAAAQVIGETKLHTFMTIHNGQLMVRVWHSTLGFSRPGSQPAWVSVRLLVPPRGAYRVTTEAFHGEIAIRRLTLSGVTVRGNVGDKLKGIPGFIGFTELDYVELNGDVDINNLAGLPGIREAVPPNLAHTAAPILVKARAGSSCQLQAVTGGDINISIQPAPDVGVKALGESNTGRVTMASMEAWPGMLRAPQLSKSGVSRAPRATIQNQSELVSALRRGRETSTLSRSRRHPWRRQSRHSGEIQLVLRRQIVGRERREDVS